MSVTSALPNAPDLSTEDYLVLGLATCFVKQDGEVHELRIVEPIPSASLEALLKGIPTSYQMAYSTTLGSVLEGTPQLPDTFPTEAQLCDDFVERSLSAARTYKARSVAQAHIPPGTVKTDFNYSVDRKRVLNSQRVIRNEDNVKQHEYTHKVL
jgi:hypothetical protein